MEGMIIFNSTAELAEFLKEFAGCTAKFEVVRIGGTADQWRLTFTGGF